MQECSNKQNYRNCMVFIVVYTLIGTTVGLIYDILITYLLAVSPGTANGIASYMGAATFAAAALGALAPKTGYKKIMIFASFVTASSLLMISYSGNSRFIGIAVFVLMTGTTMFDVMMAPYISAYTAANNRISIFTKASYFSILGGILGTISGGPMVVWIFSDKLGISYNEARQLTKVLDSLNPDQLSSYLASYHTVLLSFAVVSLLTLLPIMAVKETAEDHKSESKPGTDKVSWFSPLLNRYIVLFLVYTMLSRFTTSLIIPNISTFLTDIGIDRAAISIILTLQYIAILLFLPFSARIADRLGKVNAVALVSFATVPFLIILANGYNYGNNVELIAGGALFIRAGFANISTPIVTSLTMELVEKNYRSIYASLVFAAQGLAQISAGAFAKYYLFNTVHGYANAYFYAAALFVIAHTMLLAIFAKKYNKNQELYDY